MENITLLDMKQEFDKLTSQYLDEYMKMKSLYLQEKQLNTNSLVSIQTENSSFSNTLKEKEQMIHSLQKEIEGYKSREIELQNTITNMKQSQVVSEETNKFDLLRGQAKEITAKDKEIERLIKELNKAKELNMVKQNISVEISGGWSPTSAANPVMPDNKQIDSLNLNDSSDKPTDDSDKPTESDKPTNDSDKQNDSDESYYIITYRNKKYYRDENYKVYEIMEDDDVGKCIGNWVKQTEGKSKGKYKLIKS